MATDEAAKEIVPEQPQESEEERGRSSIGFPYGDLEDAVSIAKGVHSVGGSSCEWDQVAAHLGQASNGGGFRQKMITAKTFGVVTYSQGKVTLTPLGLRMCDPKQEKSAKADAFLTVPLYRAVYEKFKGNTLPQAKGLETEMVNLGVAKKQGDKARQVFQRSATQAGFFWSGQDRLVMPSFRDAEATLPPKEQDELADRKLKNRSGSGGDGGEPPLHPLIAGLIKALPPQDTDWPIEKRAKWLRAASQNFDFIYQDAGEDSIEINVHKGSAK